MPWGEAFEQNISAQFKCPAYARPPPPPPPLPKQLNIDRCINMKTSGCIALRLKRAGARKNVCVGAA